MYIHPDSAARAARLSDLMELSRRWAVLPGWTPADAIIAAAHTVYPGALCVPSPYAGPAPRPTTHK